MKGPPRRRDRAFSRAAGPHAGLSADAVLGVGVSTASSNSYAVMEVQNSKLLNNFPTNSSTKLGADLAPVSGLTGGTCDAPAGKRGRAAPPESDHRTCRSGGDWKLYGSGERFFVNPLLRALLPLSSERRLDGCNCGEGTGAGMPSAGPADCSSAGASTEEPGAPFEAPLSTLQRAVVLVLGDCPTSEGLPCCTLAGTPRHAEPFLPAATEAFSDASPSWTLAPRMVSDFSDGETTMDGQQETTKPTGCAISAP
eukprot:CAMPEP_0180283340 /NCGR_PEP_ID=MMETSP0988-20121125/10418_1 /TAXON_ID=697907 /ORGANISM="non described non described, Strain CCMP2293" /LENGTH=253 /DNA_ID=CAMNT_0022255855 /DNA_START=243 /DNA_END=1001 /DNA_ORIENTATION=-